MKKWRVTRELANAFPEWSRIHTDDQSIGYLFLNTLSGPLEHMQKQLQRQRANNFIPTANLDEIDLIYQTILPTTFDFAQDGGDPLETISVAPTVSGLIDNSWYDVTITEKNDIQSFWYDSIPNRISLGEVVSGESSVLIDEAANDFPVSGEFTHHLNGGHLYIEAVGGTQYLNIEEGTLYRGQVLLQGETRKGTLEEETIIVPWDMKQRTQKEWNIIHQASVMNTESGVNVVISSADYNQGPYLSQYNFLYSEQRNKIDEFWDVGTVNDVSTLDQVLYTTDEWQNLVQGFSDTAVNSSWEFLDTNWLNISGIDVALQPFTDLAWVLDDNNQVYLYDTLDTTVSGFDLLKARTAGSHIQIDPLTKTVIRGEDIEILPWHALPLKEIQKYRIWYQTPSGTKYGLLNGAQVSFTSDFYVKQTEKLKRSVEDVITISATELGEYLFVFEAEFVDGETHTDYRIVPVQYKYPLAQFDLSTLIADPLDGIEFSSDQQLWVKSNNDHYQINLHHDKMLIDFTNKVLYFREPYEEVDISND